jgi:hypothetical protein
MRGVVEWLERKEEEGNKHFYRLCAKRDFNTSAASDNGSYDKSLPNPVPLAL